MVHFPLFMLAYRNVSFCIFCVEILAFQTSKSLGQMDLLLQNGQLQFRGKTMITTNYTTKSGLPRACFVLFLSGQSQNRKVLG